MLSFLSIYISLVVNLKGLFVKTNINLFNESSKSSDFNRVLIIVQLI